MEFTLNLDQETLKSKGWKKGGWAKRKVVFDHGFPKEIKEYENYIKYAKYVLFVIPVIFYITKDGERKRSRVLPYFILPYKLYSSSDLYDGIFGNQDERENSTLIYWHKWWNMNKGDLILSYNMYREKNEELSFASLSEKDVIDGLRNQYGVWLLGYLLHYFLLSSLST